MKKKGKIIKLILLILGLAIIAGVCIYFIVFYHKTIVYKCSNKYNPGVYSSEKFDRKNWSCKIDGIYPCKDCEYDNMADGYTFFKQLREGAEKRVVNSYNYVVFDTKTKKNIATIERAYPHNSTLVYNDDELVALKLSKYEGDEGHSIIYNLKKNKETVALNYDSGFHSRKYMYLPSYGNGHFNSKDNDLDEENITNNIIIATEPVIGKTDSDELGTQLFGLVNIDTGKTIVPIKSNSFYRTKYGNFISITYINKGYKRRLYDANGNLKYEQGQIDPNPAYVIEDAGNNQILVDNLTNFYSKYFELIDYDGKKDPNSKIYWSDIIKELSKQIKKTEYSNKYSNINDDDIIEAYEYGNFRIECYPAIDSSDLKYIEFDFYDSESVEEQNRIFKPLIATVTYEYNDTEKKFKAISD